MIRKNKAKKLIGQTNMVSKKNSGPINFEYKNFWLKNLAQKYLVKKYLPGCKNALNFLTPDIAN